jgi:gluconolactonase
MKPQLFALSLFLACKLFAQQDAPSVVTYHDKAGKLLVSADVVIDRLHTGMKFVEGPVWLAKESALVFSDIPRAKLLRWTEKAGVVDWRDSEQSNGNTLDLDGHLLSAQHRGRNVIRHGRDGKVAVLASACDGKKFHSPNDLAVRTDGSIWFTDPTYGLGKRKREAPGNFVYRLDPKIGVVTIVQRDFAMPNGICFSPDHSRVYIADSGKKQRVGAFEVQPDGTLSKPLFWLTGGADGIRCDVRGNLFTTARDGVRIYSEAGQHLATVKMPEQPANCAFGGADGNELFVTARTSLYRMRLRVSGAAIPPLRPAPADPKAPESKGAGR